jgi:hypothetical protein
MNQTSTLDPRDNSYSVGIARTTKKTRPEQLKRILEYKLRQKYRISSGTKSGFRNKSAVGGGEKGD